MKKIFILFIIGLLFSCHTTVYHNPPNTNRTDEFELVKVDSILFPLDSKTSNLTIASQYDPKQDYFSFLSNNKEIIVFDYSSQKEIKRISTQGIGASSYEFFSPDTLVLFGYSTKELVLIDTLGNLSKKFLIRPNIRYSPSPIVKIAPLIKQDDHLLFTGNIAGEYTDETDENRLVTGIYDLKTKKVRYEMPYPKIYEKYNWGSGMFRWVYATYNEVAGKIVYSFPADHYIQVAESDFSEVKNFLAGSKYIDNIRPYSRYKLKPISSEKRMKQFAENHTYSNIIYDRYNDIYYRIAEMKTPYDGILGWNKEISIIILDSDFKVVGETFIGKTDNSNRYTLFVSPQGLHISNPNNEDFMKFDIYKLNKL